ncbi:MAG TPA: PspC domain-containing protein [Trebonia sp.]
MQEQSRPSRHPRRRRHDRHGWHDDHGWLGWHDDRDGSGRDRRREDWAERLAERSRRWGGTWNGQPLRRDPGDRLAGGVAAGLARWRGFNPTNVRIILVIAALFSQGWLIPFYFAAWLLIPVGDAVPGNRRFKGRKGPPRQRMAAGMPPAPRVPLSPGLRPTSGAGRGMTRGESRSRPEWPRCFASSCWKPAY